MNEENKNTENTVVNNNQTTPSPTPVNNNEQAPIAPQSDVVNSTPSPNTTNNSGKNNANPTAQVDKNKINTEVLEAPKEDAVDKSSFGATDNFIKAHEAMKDKPKTEPTEQVEVLDEPFTFKKKVQIFFLIIFFILVAVFIFYLPVIREYLNNEQQKQEEVTTGVLSCRIERNSEGNNIKIKDEFTFKDKKLKKYKRTKDTKGSSASSSKLEDIDTECNKLLEENKSLSGVDIACNLKGKTQTTVENLDYETLNIRKVTSAFTEAGGTYPDYERDEDIDKIESTMRRSGFKCERTRRN